jgi:hypothetical protein
MATNERVDYSRIDIDYAQKATSQANRANWTPGTTGSRQGDAVFQDFAIPTSNTALDVSGPVEMERKRIVKLGRNIVSDQVIAAPVSDTPVTVTIDDDRVWGTGADPEYTITPTDTQNANGKQERTAGYDWPEGAA